MGEMTLDRAVDAFGRGFSFTRSFTHPYEYVRVGPLRVMRDAPRRKGAYRSQEILIFGMNAAEAMAAIRDYGPEGRYFVCVIHGTEEASEEIKEAYKAQGLRAMHREPMMVRRLVELEDLPESSHVQRVTTGEEADRVAKAARNRQVLPEHLGLENSPLRLYFVEEDWVPVGWVRSVEAGEGARWVSNLYVRPECRRRGIAQALMAAMLRDDAASGAEYSVLLSSSQGAQLYPRLGYEMLGLLQVFVPPKVP